MKPDSVRNKSPKRASRIILLSILIGVAACLPFSTMIFAWQVGHPRTIGIPILILSTQVRYYALIISGVCLLLAVVSLCLKRRTLTGGLIALSAIGALFSFRLLYNPFSIILWVYSYWNIPQLTSCFDHTLFYSIGYFLYVQFGIYLLTKTGPVKPSGSHGTAKIEKGDHLIQDSGIIVGRRKGSGRLLRYDGEQHLFTMAATGGGKGVGAIIPNLLTYDQSIIVVDPKGENCNFTVRQRQRMSQNIYVLDPFQETLFARDNGSNKLNPLDAIDPGDQDMYEQCNHIAFTAFPLQKREDFWTKSGRGLFRELLIYICTAPEFNDPMDADYHPELRNIATITDLLSMRNKDLLAYAEHVYRKQEIPLKHKRWASQVLTAGESKKMLASITEELLSNIQFLNSNKIRSSIYESDFEIKDIISSPSTLYIVIPTDKLDEYSPWINMVIEMIIKKSIKIRGTNLRKDQVDKILFMLDEFANLGRIEPILRAYSLLRGYGFIFWIFLQDISQLKNLYPNNWMSFIANSGIRQIFEVNDPKTANFISEFMGQKTVFVKSDSHRMNIDNLGLPDNNGLSQSYNEKGRRLKTPNELLTMDSSEQILIQNRHHPIIADKIAYWNDDVFKPLAPKRGEIDQLLKEIAPCPIPDLQKHIGNKLKEIIYGEQKALSFKKDRKKNNTTPKAEPPKEDNPTPPGGLPENNQWNLF